MTSLSEKIEKHSDVAGVRQPKQLRSRRTLDRLLQAAEVLIATHGVDGLTLAALLQDSQVSNGTFYARFSSMDALVHEVQHQALARMETAVAAAGQVLVAEDADLARSIDRIIGVIFQNFQKNTDLFGALLADSSRDPIMQRRAALTHNRIEAVFRKVLLRALPAAERELGAARIAIAHAAVAGILLQRCLAGRASLQPFGGSWVEEQKEVGRLILHYLTSGQTSEATEAEVPSMAATAVARLSTGGKRVSSYSQGKVEKILDAARQLFMRHGYGLTSIDEVAAAAKVSKATVYAHFQSKAQLFAAVVGAESQSQLIELATDQNTKVADTLYNFGERAFDLLVDSSTVSKLRMIASEAERFPELGGIFYAAGPARLNAGLAAFLHDAMARGQLRSDDPDLAAAHFLNLLCGDLRIQQLVGINVELRLPERRRLLKSGIAAFLRAYAPEVRRQSKN
jgi:TetR/AcrR family transcriptional regulator, mexJK operon transcriptional repressor